MKALVINGPNLNMLGIREPDIYGTDTYEALVQVCRVAAEALGLEDVEVFQSNHEGAIVDRIQEAYGNVDGIVINPAGTRTPASRSSMRSRPWAYPQSRSTSPPSRSERNFAASHMPAWRVLRM